MRFDFGLETLSCDHPKPYDRRKRRVRKGVGQTHAISNGSRILKRFATQLVKIISAINFKQAVIYVAVFVVFFSATMYLFFPYEAVKSRIVTEIEAKTGAKVIIDSLKPLRMSGLTIRGIKVLKPFNPSQAIANIDMVRFRIHLLPLFFANLITDFDLIAYGGGLSGVMEARGGKGTAIAVNFKDLDLQKYNFDELVQKYGNLNLQGKLTGALSLFFDKAKARNNQGSVALSFEGLKTSNTVILTKTLPDIVFEPGTIKMDFKSNGFSISEWEMIGDNLSISMNGRLTLLETFAKSRIGFTVKFKLSEDIEDLFPEMGMLAAPDNAGWYKLTLNGPLNKPNIKMR